MDINFKILQSKYFNDFRANISLVIKIFAPKNSKINIHQKVNCNLFKKNHWMNSNIDEEENIDDSNFCKK